MHKQKINNIVIIILNWINIVFLGLASGLMFSFDYNNLQQHSIAISIVSIVITAYAIFISTLFTIKHNRYEFKLGDLLLSVAEIIGICTILSFSLIYYKGFNFGGSTLSIPAIAMIIASIITCIKFIFEITLFIGWKKHLYKTNFKPYAMNFKIKSFKDWFYVNNPKALFYPISGFISSMSIFGMFGKLAKVNLSGSKLDYPVNMFEGAFGIGKYNTMYGKGASAGLIILFLVLTSVLILSAIDFFRYKKLNKGFYIYSNMRLILILTAAILAFCSIYFIKENDPTAKPMMSLGSGPLSVGIMNIIAAVLCLGGDCFALITSNKTSTTSKKQQHSKDYFLDTISNDEKSIKLLVKYKKLLDDGIITKKEFEEKKKKLL